MSIATAAFERAPARFAPPLYFLAVPIAEASGVRDVEEPARDTVTLLGREISRFVRSVLRSTTHEAFMETLYEGWADYRENLDALRTVVAASTSQDAARAKALDGAREVAQHIERAAGELRGDDGADEAVFATETYRRACDLLPAIFQHKAVDGGHDMQHAIGFAGAAALHGFAALALCVAATTRPSESAIDTSFELLRAGALDAYAHARLALSLRAKAETLDDDTLADDDELASDVDLAESL